MKSSFLLALGLLASPVLAADTPADEVKAAAKKLSEAANYSWSSKTAVPEGTQGNRGGGASSIEGKITKGGIAHLVTTRGDNTTETIVKGDKSATKTDNGWQTPEERRAAREAAGGGGGGGGAGGGGRRGGGFGFFSPQNFKAPAEQAEALVGQVKDLKKEGDVISGALTEEAAKAEVLGPFGGGPRRDGGEAPAPTDAKGSVKFWLKDGALAKFEIHCEGKMTFGDNERTIDRTRTFEIKDVGTTKVDVPEEATKKLEGAPAGEKKAA